ncbi:eukaryotic peptide chain release factor GTP-binding subunit ERF3A isoform X1 [Iris pallida]|uniref:Eukaryotic peptide chain release factor GTP-binding subunit ERF3A isoform X1 n=1 Tax=Iris pallida TaxID=29817 RepID=A0AAX6G5P4_IRIPA|nr:eukaryotic peptide chain release factor GTP-binding subunit ERF3A isoform X1 [Iris pallida]
MEEESRIETVAPPPLAASPAVVAVDDAVEDAVEEWSEKPMEEDLPVADDHQSPPDVAMNPQQDGHDEEIRSSLQSLQLEERGKEKETAALEELDEKEEEKKRHLNLVFIGHVDAGKSTTGGQILLLSGQVDDRTIQKYEKEAKEKNRESCLLYGGSGYNQLGAGLGLDAPRHGVLSVSRGATLLTFGLATWRCSAEDYLLAIKRHNVWNNVILCELERS